MITAVPEVLGRILVIFTLALGVRIVVDVWLDVPYAVVLILAGVGVSAVPFDVGIPLSNEILLAVVLPAVLFDGATALNRDVLRENWVIPAVLVVFGVPLAVTLLGALSAVVFELPLLVSLLLAAIVVPTDPVAVLSIFEEIASPAYLTTIIESESLFNDGVAITLFGVVLSLLAAGPTPGIDRTVGVLVGDLFVVGVGGFLIGGLLGSVARVVVRRIRERMAVLLVTILLAYGSYLVADVVLGASGILATVGAGLFLDVDEGRTDAEGREDVDGGANAFVRDVWDGGAFLLSTFVYVLIGANVPLSSVIEHLWAVLAAAVLVFLVRAVVVTVLLGFANTVVENRIPLGSQYVLVWGGLHTVVPIALALGLPGWVPYHEFIQAVVFGVAIFGALVQGSLLPTVLRISGGRARPSWVAS